jgi:hypothetical protein
LFNQLVEDFGQDGRNFLLYDDHFIAYFQNFLMIITHGGCAQIFQQRAKEDFSYVVDVALEVWLAKILEAHFD